MPAPRAVLTDIEGTTTPIAYVRDVLFVHARACLPAFLARHAARPDVAAILADVAALAPGQPALDTLRAWMDADAKITPLKTLQGLIWHEAYRAGTLHGRIYPDVPAALRRWHAAGIRLEVYSSGSAAAQRLLFGHSDAGDLAALFSAFHDTAIGAKTDRSSYAAIAAAGTLAPGDYLFLSDAGAELDAARAAGMCTCQLMRPADGTHRADAHAAAAGFDEVERAWRDD